MITGNSVETLNSEATLGQTDMETSSPSQSKQLTTISHHGQTSTVTTINARIGFPSTNQRTIRGIAAVQKSNRTPLAKQHPIVRGGIVEDSDNLL